MKTDDVPERVLVAFKKWGFNHCEIVGNWNGFVIWAPLPEPGLGIQCIGAPFFVIDDGEHARGSSPKEGFELLDYLYGNKEE